MNNKKEALIRLQSSSQLTYLDEQASKGIEISSGNLTEKEFALQQELFKLIKKYDKQLATLDKLTLHSYVKGKIEASIQERHFEEANRVFIRHFSDNQ
jgi:hypothetical protein